MIGIYGGTFDPVHFGHLRTAVELLELFNLTELRLIPCANPPHRQTPLTSASLRLQMLQLAVAGQAGLVVDACELERAGASYTIDTLRGMRLKYPNSPLLLFMGVDAFAGLAGWHQWQQLFDYANIVVITRPGYAYPEPLAWMQDKLTDRPAELNQIDAGKLFFQAVTPLAIAATTIRQMIAAGRNPRFLLPDTVINFIRQRQLYTTYNPGNIPNKL